MAKLRRLKIIVSGLIFLDKVRRGLSGLGVPSDKWEDEMASDKSRNLQEVFLNNVRKSHVAVTVFLVNGVKLRA